MTDKQLQQLLTTTPLTPERDEVFINQVMHQLPKTDLSWRPIWTIRLTAAMVGLTVLFFSSELTPLLSDILLLAHTSGIPLLAHTPWTTLLLAGLAIATTTLWICHRHELI